MASENDGSSFLTGLLLGGIIGAVLGLLFAPQPGEKTREQLRARADEFVSLGRRVEGETGPGQAQARLTSVSLHGGYTIPCEFGQQ